MESSSKTAGDKLITVAPAKGEAPLNLTGSRAGISGAGMSLSEVAAEFAVAQIGQGGGAAERFRRQPIAEALGIVDALAVNGGDDIAAPQPRIGWPAP